MINRVAIFILCALALLVVPAATAQADTATQLPFRSPGSAWLSVDPSGGHVFVSGGPGNSSIIVLNYAGTIVKTISGESGASQMALDPATHTLYVALHDANAISEINTQTLTETKRFSTAPYTGPSSLVIAGGKLWFSCSDGVSDVGCLVSANLDGSGMASPVPQSTRVPPLFLAAGGTNNHLLALADDSDSPPDVSVYNVSTSTPSLVSSGPDPYGDSQEIADMTFTAGGANLLLATGVPDFIQSLSTSTLKPNGNYPTGQYPFEVAATANGRYVAGAIRTENATGGDVFVYPVGSPKQVRMWNVGTKFGDAKIELPEHALAFSPDANELFAVANGPSGHLEFDVLSKPTVPLPTTRTSLHRSTAAVQYGRHTTLKVRVRGTKTGKVALFAGPLQQGAQPIATKTLHAGATKFTVTPRNGETTYTALLEQGARYAYSTSRGVTIKVHPIITIATHQLRRAVIYQGFRAIQTNLIGRTRPERQNFYCTCGDVSPPETMGFVVQKRSGAGWRKAVTLTPANIGPGGIKHGEFITNGPGLYRARAVYTGDNIYLPSESPWKTFHVRHFPGDAG